MNKVHLTITVDSSIIEACRGLKVNVSALCNTAIRAYLHDHRHQLIRDAEQQVKLTREIVQTTQERAKDNGKVVVLLQKAATARAEGKEFKKFLDAATHLTKVPIWKLLKRM